MTLTDTSAVLEKH